jgi:DNA-binding MarR family transcriptional regulator
MPIKPHEVTSQAVVEFMRKMFKTAAEKYGGDCTLNELRVMNQIIRCHLEGRSCSVTALHRVTGIPVSTVSRAVTHLHADNWIAERQDPDDGRRRIISLGPRSLGRTRDDIEEAVRWINEFREHGLPT